MSRPFARTVFTLLTAAIILSSLPLRAASLLFPKPLHLTHRVHDSISGTTTVVEQFFYGDRAVTISGSVTTITDYDKSEVTEIDRAEGVYSISRFDQVAKALHPAAVPEVSSTGAKQQWELRKLGRTGALSARSTDVFEADRTEPEMTRHVHIGVDSSVSLSKDALDVITGAAFPASPKAEHAAILAAARAHAPVIASSSANGSKAAETYALPVEQSFTFDAEGQHAEYQDVVIRVGDELPSPDLIAIPPGATLVESRLIKTSRMIDAIDRLPLDGLKTP